MRRRGPGWGLLAAIAVLAVALAGGLWWMLSGAPSTEDDIAAEISRSLEAAEEPATDTGGATPPPPLSDDTVEGRDWITVFSPNEPTLANAPADASAEVMEDDSGAFLRIRSGEAGSAVSFDVGPGILEQVAGGRAFFNIIARAEEGMPTEILVECDFGTLGNCGRKRYPVNYERGDFLFDIELPDAQPDDAGAISITSDASNEGKAVDIYEIRVSPAE
jgi:hypothetical protein